MAGITVEPMEGTAEDVVSALKSFAVWYGSRHPVAHALTVQTGPFAGIAASADEDAPCGFAAFMMPEAAPEETHEASIFVGGLFPDLLMHEEPETTREQGLEATVENLAHELVHYEQWRDGRKVQERGVNVRARNLVKKWKSAGN